MLSLAKALVRIMEQQKKRRGDRKDAYLVRESDPMHRLMPYMLPGRTANEAVMNEEIDLTSINAFLEKKNADDPEFRYTFFHVICAAMAKTIMMRPKLNRFYSANKLYQRKEISFSFVIKKKFTDDAAEALAFVRFDPSSGVSPLEQVYTQVKNAVYSVRKEGKKDGSTDKMEILLKLPGPILSLAVRFLKRLEAHGHYPASLMKDDPYYTTVFVTNLGSIRMHASYHHIAEWGTNSIFLVIGEKKPSPFYNETGFVGMRDTLSLGLTADERIADGVYFAGSMRLMKKLLAEPELLEHPANEQIDY